MLTRAWLVLCAQATSSTATDGAADGKPHGAYWTAQYMASAAASASAADRHWGLAGGMSPLAAVFAAKWRQQVRLGWCCAAACVPGCRANICLP